ncbi:CLUMA_CG004547, isoform A [Clunio marinus]|uniref:CLUMA_CG004547, isoform A n=1 Tax=Clunio marinus TaxID=568069 RepID=A0A1J1HXJ1_9DIPT|nr:CLUMA_CG004547, isoform A [Clunio marinus]
MKHCWEGKPERRNLSMNKKNELDNFLGGIRTVNERNEQVDSPYPKPNNKCKDKLLYEFNGLERDDIYANQQEGEHFPAFNGQRRCSEVILVDGTNSFNLIYNESFIKEVSCKNTYDIWSYFHLETRMRTLNYAFHPQGID